MSTNANDAEYLANEPWLRTAETFQTQHPSAPLVYPRSGATQHLPIRRTITGDAAQPNPNAARMFLHDLPGYCYSLPRVSMNFTLVEIIVFLPNWFKYKEICERFMNNNLTAKVHFMILDEHRELRLDTEFERTRARSTLTSEYRKTMRSFSQGWKKAKHTAPSDWDPTSMDMGGYVPDDMRHDGYRQVPPMLFRDLMSGVKKMPEGVHAGDLTRALQFALSAGPHNFMFPDDLPNILDHIGRTQMTIAHADRSIIRGYVDKKLVEEAKTAPGTIDPINHTGTYGSFPLAQDSEPQTMSRDSSIVPLQQAKIPISQSHIFPSQMPPQLRPVSEGVQPYAQFPPQIMETENHAAGHQTHPDQGSLWREEIEMEALVRHHLDYDGSEFGYASEHPLRDCIEGDILFDGSPLARAARFAQRSDQVGTLWCVAHVNWLVQLLDAAQAENSA